MAASASGSLLGPATPTVRPYTAAGGSILQAGYITPPPDAQRGMARRAGATSVEIRASHSVAESNPATVVAVIERAARAAGPLRPTTTDGNPPAATNRQQRQDTT
jgi:hypothetical protein